MKKFCNIHNLEYEEKQFVMCGFNLLSQCPECVAERKAIQEAKAREEIQREYAERKAIQDKERFTKLNIEPEFYGATFDNYIAQTETQKQALFAVKELVKGNCQKVILLGGNGIGKSHLGSVAVKETDGLIMTAYEIGLFVRGGIPSGDEQNRLEKLATVPLLVVDEFSRSKMSEAERNWHSYIFDKRHVRGLRTMLIDNSHFHRNCIKGGCEKCFENLLDNDSISRFIQNGYILTMDGADLRREKKITL